jgi:hypothetical protein
MTSSATGSKMMNVTLTRGRPRFQANALLARQSPSRRTPSLATARVTGPP